MPMTEIGIVPDDIPDPVILDTTPRFVRGSGFSRHAPNSRSAIRERHLPTVVYPDFGFRVVRTISPDLLPLAVTDDWSAPPGEARFAFHGNGTQVELTGTPSGVQVTPSSFRTPATVRVTSIDGTFKTFEITARATNANATYELRGIVGQPTWDLEYFAWPADLQPERQNHPDFAALSSLPAIRQERSLLRFDWHDGPPGADLPADHFGLRARSEVELPQGVFEFFLRFDEGLALRLDNVLIYDGRHNVRTIPINFWRELNSGHHTLDVAYFERAGDASLQFQLRRLDSVVRIAK
jgi:hypothetical protein